MKLVDANVFIYCFTNAVEKESCREFILNNQIITNSLVLLEVFAKLSTIVNREYAKQTVKEIYKSGNITVIDVDKNLFFFALRNVEHSKLSVSDHIHYSTAVQNNCSSIVSYDKDFDGLDIMREEP